MSGCCGQGPVIVSGAAATPRVDVETVLLCDVLADGTIASVALVEPIYDTNTGARVGTRTVDPVTGATYTPVGTLQPCQPDGCNATTTAQVLCDTATNNTVTHFMRATTYDCQGALLGTLDRTLDGAAYTVTGTVGVCPTSPDCESPTTPTATVGLCLVDGTPIAVTVVRDCTGATTSEGWINLTTGAWSAGAVPAGTVACGESRSIQVSGTFCDVDAAGEVVGLVLVEYTYDDTGAISAVRLVNAVTGGTYTPTGTVTVCPAGVEQPEQDIVQLCDVQADGTMVPFIRDYRRDELGAVSGHSDYTLTGAAYVPTGAVGNCQPEPQPERDLAVLCDTQPDDTVVAFLRDYQRDTAGAVTGHQDYALDGGTYTVLGTVGRCDPECQTAAVQTFRLCDLNPAVEPNEAGLRCATPFLRHFTYGCDGTATPHDTAMDGSTPYTPVEVVECGDNPPSLREQVWNTVSVTADPSDATGATFIYTVANSENPVQTGTVKMTASKAPGGGCTTSPTAPVWNAGVTFVFEPDATVLELASVLRVDAIDWDDWEDKFLPSGGPASGGTWPAPGRVEADLPFTNVSATRWHSTAANNTGHFYFSGPPAAVAMGNRNDGGGLACVAPSFGFITLVPGPPCGAEECLNCETLLLCDDGANDPATIRGMTVSSGTLPNGVTWSTTGTSSGAPGSGAPVNSRVNNADGAWWNTTYSFPNTVTGAQKWTFSKPVDVEFSVYIHPGDTGTGGGTVQLPAGVEAISLPQGYHVDPATNVLSIDSTADSTCTNLTAPNKAASVRFRTTNEVTALTLDYLGNRIAACGQFGNWAFGAFDVTPSGQFLRTICRACDGTVSSATDTELDGQTAYTPAGTVKVCQDPQPADCCQPVQVCISATTTETIEFISNEAQVDDDTRDTVWTWTNAGDANGPAAGATWYQMYRARYGFAPAAWSVVDSAPTRKAGWISPHPNGATTTTGAPGEGPTLSGTAANPMRWWARAGFSLPAAAAPDSIRIQITVLNADQIASRFRLNSGAWTSLPASATYNGTPYTFGPGVVPGAQPGTNTLYFEVLETVEDNPGNGAGVMAHFIVTYDVPGLGQRSWTRMVCCDGSVHYIDEFGDREDELPPSSAVVPCGSSAQPLVLCDDNGPFIRHVSYVGDQVLTTDTDLNGTAYGAVGPVRSCGA